MSKNGKFAKKQSTLQTERDNNESASENRKRKNGKTKN